MARAVVILGGLAGLFSVGGLFYFAPSKPVEKPVAPWIQALEQGTVITLSKESMPASNPTPARAVAEEVSLVPPPPAAVLPQQPPTFPRQTANR